MFLILKKCLVSFSMHTLLFWHGSLITQWVKLILLITQNSHLSSFLMFLIKTGGGTLYTTKKKLQATGKDEDYYFMNVLLASKNLR